MSMGNHALMLRVYEAVNSRDRQALIDLLAPDFEFLDTRAFPEPHIYPGPEAAWTYFGELWSEVRFEIDTLKDAGDKMLVLLRERQRGTSPLGVTMRFAHVWTVRQHQLARLQVHLDPADAWDALGLRG